MRRPSSKQRRLVILVLAVLTFAIAYYAGNHYSYEDPPLVSGILLRPALSAPDFTLLDQNGSLFSEKQLTDHWNLMLFNPNLAANPSGLNRLVQIHNRLASDPTLQQQIQFIYVSQQAVEKFTPQMETGFYLLNGSVEELSEIFSRFDIAETNSGFTLYLIDTDGGIQALFTDQQDAVTIAEDLKSIILHYR